MASFMTKCAAKRKSKVAGKENSGLATLFLGALESPGMVYFFRGLQKEQLVSKQSEERLCPVISVVVCGLL